MDLNSMMAFDHVIRVNEDGTIDEPIRDRYAPELYALSDSEGQHTPDTDPNLISDARDAGWELLSGWTGQYGYSGVCMHPSEFIGGSLAEHILETPGYWVAVVVTEDIGDAEHWAIAYAPLEG